MTSAPSSPVPAVERIELPGGWYFQQLNPPHGILYALRTPKGQGFGVNGTGMSVGRPVVEAFAAAMSTPTPGRAAEPDTMGEVERLTDAFGFQMAQASYTSADTTRDALFSAVRTNITERDDARTRAETAEAQLATRGWQDISTAPKDGTVIWVYAPAYDGLDAITSICAWHEDAGFCIDELRSPTHWQPLNAPTAPATEADR